MELLTYRAANGWRPGLRVGEHVVDSQLAARTAELDGSLERDLASNRQLLQLSEEKLARLMGGAEALQADEQCVGEVGSVELGPPIADPSKILCLGLNYVEHAEEMGLERSAMPVIFAKFANALVGTRQPIVLPSMSEQVDYEGELALVIGRRCKDVPREQAFTVIAGYMAFNDVSARDLQMSTSQWTPGKAMDTFAPCGPGLVMAGNVDDAQDLVIRTHLNGEVVQEASTALMIHPIDVTIARISSLMTLEPGDIIATGTPAGVGYTREPPVFLKHGDVVRVEIEQVGVLENHVDGSRSEARDG